MFQQEDDGADKEEEYIRSGTRPRGSKSECNGAGGTAQVVGLYREEREGIDSQEDRGPNRKETKRSVDWKAKEKPWLKWAEGGRMKREERGKRWGKVRNRRKVRMWP